MASSTVEPHGEGFVRFSAIDHESDLLIINVWPNGDASALINEDNMVLLDNEALLKLRDMLNSRFP